MIGLDLEGDEAYSFHLHPSFEPDTAIRIARTGDWMMLTAWLATGSWFDPWLGRRKVLRHLTREEWAALIEALERADFWSLPEDDRRIGLDGETWDFEGMFGSRRQRISRWCPEDDAIVELGWLFLHLAWRGVGYG
ncbi:hypothetical protein [Magnetospirillum sp. UT-4]|uniref:hypothetical protein n=1 Tax=Magnetospirillum sp. UT-4 TaxID=2681467 RepID=UPI00137FD253|nr:hypothetical protein [Magnetospirillum sp. UT-4]CAA7615673.1 hypothetical protein MTBUT4_200013 [Magnetospirillum sp. UT-4]